ncbi:MAG TPA: Gfo/Idh/MocA family oxidoreductase, partial [Patescibacteria group bacterium]|nr:Gfo/Idh/MocA family oxidoreductase [Patescibacteria group bacterium]
MPGKKISVCLIGAGRMGARWVEAMKKHCDIRVLVVTDVNESEGKKLAELAGARFALPKTLPWTTSDIDAVFIVTPHKFLFPYAKQALHAGKHVFVEKPGSRTAAEMRQLLSLARRKRRQLSVGFNYRHFTNIAKAHQMVLDGKIGELLFLRVVHGHPGRPGYDREWRMKKNEAGGGVLMDQGMHVIDLVNWFLPSKRFRVASATQSRLFWKRSDVEEQAFLILKNERAQMASVQTGVTQWKPVFTLEVYGNKG